VSVDGVTALSTSFDHVGLIAAHPEAIERALAALAPDLEPPSSLPCRIGFAPDRLATSAPVVRDAVERALGWLAAEGFVLVEVELPDRVELAEMHGAIVCAEALTIWRDDWPRNADRFADTARRSLAYAAQMPTDEIAAARARLPAARARIEAAFAEADLVIGPTIAVPTPQVDARRVLFDGAEVPIVFALLAETCPFNISGQPALAVPLPWHDHGIPISLQIAGRHGRDLDLIAFARKLQEISSSA
jgi:aspartyl-tRNA(Asn)/glutamyl-tRNA(Gln) amidotransferase subunit A